MDRITTIGIDPAKSVFQIHGVREDGTVALRRKLRRGQVPSFFAACPPCLIGLEGCAGAHYWARALIALGHDVRIMPFFATNAPRSVRLTLEPCVKPYVERGKTNGEADRGPGGAA